MLAKKILGGIITFVASSAFAQTASMKINSDLLLHPSQIGNVFVINADKINKTATWDWPALQFQQPYKTWWNQVQARGPFTLNVRTDQLGAQELTFELYWQDPVVTVGEFLVKDTIVKNLGGVQVIINVEGRCSGMDWKAANGLWKVRGKVGWGIINQELVVHWKEFEFVSNPAAPQPVTNLGQCQGPAEIQDALRANVMAVTQDQAAMQDMMRRGLLAWMNNSLHNFKVELMKARSGVLQSSGMKLDWQPQFMVMVPGGMLRIPGYVTLKKEGVSTMPGVVDRTLPEVDYATITESAFILPKNVLEHVASFAYTTGDLSRRYKSTEIKAFNDLMNNRLNQSVVWPDLEKFSTSTLFYFDVLADAVPQMSNLRQGAVNNGGGVLYDMKAPILVHDLAPYRGKYHNYVDFRSNVTGGLRISVKSQQLNVQMSASSVPLTAKFRPEFKTQRAVDEKIDTSRLGTAGRDFINGKTQVVPLPQFDLGETIKMVYGDLKIFKQSVTLPVSFQKK